MNYISLYAGFLRKFYRLAVPVRVVFDSSDGVTGPVLKALNSGVPKLKAAYLNARPNGRFPAHGPDPLKPGATNELKRALLKRRADLGIIFDGDGDRVFFLNDRGKLINSDQVAYALRSRFKPPYLADVRAGRLLRDRQTLVSRVGHSYIKIKMREHRISFGAELTGHYYFKDFFYCDSGILAAIMMLNAVSELKAQGNTLTHWLGGLPQYHRIPETNFLVKNKEAIMRRVRGAYRRSARRITLLDGLSMDFDDFWFNIRPSNTEPFLRLNMEAGSVGILNRELKRIKKFFADR